jgi:hypothetical protein
MIDSTFLFHAICPQHGDHSPSFAIYDDNHGHCYVCGYHQNEGVLSVSPARREKFKPPILPWSMVTEYISLLQGPLRSRIGWFWGRGILPLTVEKLRFGHTGTYFTVPVWDEAGVLLTVRYRRDDRLVAEDHPKYKGLAGSKRNLYGLWQATFGRTVVLTEGELDAALLMQECWRHSTEQLVPMSVTCGAQSLTPDLAQKLVGCRGVLVAYDVDTPGNDGAEKAIQTLQSVGIPAERVSWPLEWGKDPTEAIAYIGASGWMASVLGIWL